MAPFCFPQIPCSLSVTFFTHSPQLCILRTSPALLSQLEFQSVPIPRFLNTGSPPFRAPIHRVLFQSATRSLLRQAEAPRRLWRGQPSGEAGSPSPRAVAAPLPAFPAIAATTALAALAAPATARATGTAGGRAAQAQGSLRPGRRGTTSAHGAFGSGTELVDPRQQTSLCCLMTPSDGVNRRN